VKSVSSKFAILAMALSLAVGMAFAQDNGPASGSEPMHHGMHGHFMGEMGMGLPLHQLNLTDDQKTQIHQIVKTEHSNMKPLMQQEFKAHQAMIALVTSGNFDQTKAAVLAAQESQTHAQIEVEHAKIASQIYALLSSDQKAKVSDIITKHQQMMQQHMQNQNEAAPEPPDQQ